MTRPVGLKEPEKYIRIGKGKSPRFKEGNPGRPKGSLNKVTLLKNKILDAALSRNLNGRIVRYTKKGRKYYLNEVSTPELMKVGATFVPKELKGTGFENMKTIINIVKTYADSNRSTSGNKSHRTETLPKANSRV